MTESPWLLPLVPIAIGAVAVVVLVLGLAKHGARRVAAQIAEADAASRCCCNSSRSSS